MTNRLDIPELRRLFALANDRHGPWKPWLGIERADKVLAMVPGVRWVCLGTTKHGSPRHPLYVRSTQPMVPFAMGSVDAAKEPTP